LYLIFPEQGTVLDRQQEWTDSLDKPLVLQSLLSNDDDYSDCHSRNPGHKNVCIKISLSLVTEKAPQRLHKSFAGLQYLSDI